jgi:hypothetical protein
MIGNRRQRLSAFSNTAIFPRTKPAAKRDFAGRELTHNARLRLRDVRISLEMSGNIFPKRNKSRTPYPKFAPAQLFRRDQSWITAAKKGSPRDGQPRRFVSTQQTSV